MRAVSFNLDAAKLMGISTDRIIAITFALGSAFAAAAGVLVAMAIPKIDPLMGIMSGLKAFVAAVLGGIGNVPGALLGGLIIGIAEVVHGGLSVADVPRRDRVRDPDRDPARSGPRESSDAWKRKRCDATVLALAIAGVSIGSSTRFSRAGSSPAARISPYVLQVLTLAGINIILAVSSNLINGFTGQFSIGHAGFMAIGAYTSAFISFNFGARLERAVSLPAAGGRGAVVLLMRARGRGGVARRSRGSSSACLRCASGATTSRS